MKIICVDDEKLVLTLVATMCRELPGAPVVRSFQKANDALEYLRERIADIAILDINMPDMNGLLLAEKIREIRPDIAIIFLTGYSEYALDAFSMHASGYLLKPVEKERLAAEVEYAMSVRRPAAGGTKEGQKHIVVHTFGEFNIYVDGVQVSFERSKAKEVLAFLVDRNGDGVSRSDIFYHIWDSGSYDRSMQKQEDVIIRSLKATMEKYGILDIIRVNKGVIKIVPEMIDCDMYRYMKGDPEAVNAFRGEYMNDYSWARITESYIDSLGEK